MENNMYMENKQFTVYIDNEMGENTISVPGLVDGTIVTVVSKSTSIISYDGHKLTVDNTRRLSEVDDSVCYIDNKTASNLDIDFDGGHIFISTRPLPSTCHFVDLNEE